jgi:exopolysaccharide biosynthesis polyprenyl glycosylphosphotransferase
MDIALSTIGLILCIPLFVAVAIAIKRDSPGPVIFKQQRVGKDGKKFTMYKFRTMVVNAEEILDELLDENEVDGPVFKIKEDPRVTKSGKWLRKTSIDELPQLWNVLKGDMSLVGPRPPLEREVVQYDDYQRQRLSVKPGITCYWQVSGRSNISFDEWVELDIKYIHEQSLWTDIKLLFKTIGAVLRKDGAY